MPHFPENGNVFDASGFVHVPVVIPACNPTKKLLPLVEALAAAGFRRVLIVDDGSDGEHRETIAAAAEIGICQVFTHAVNLGKGRAIKTAINHILVQIPDACGCVIASADGQHAPEDIVRCARELVTRGDQLILGVRDFERPILPKASRIGNKAARLAFRFMVGMKLADVQTGLRGIPRAFLPAFLSVVGERYEFETNMLIYCKKNDLGISEFPMQTIYVKNQPTSEHRAAVDSMFIALTFAKYIFSSLSASLIDLVLFGIFCEILDGNGALATAGLYVTVATFAARLISASYNYLMNYRVVFKSRSSRMRSLSRFVLLALVQVSMSAFLVTLLHGIFGGEEVLFKVPVDFALFFVNYYFQRELVYK